MSDLSKEDLQRLTTIIAERYQELDLPDTAMPNLGMVRIVYDVIAAHLQSKATDPSTLLPSTLLRGTLSPLRSQLDDEDAQRKRQEEFDAIVAEIKHVAMGGIMPRMNTWDAAKPVHMPKSQAIINRYQKTWGQLAEIAGLRMDKKETVAMKPVAHLNGTFNE